MPSSQHPRTKPTLWVEVSPGCSQPLETPGPSEESDHKYGSESSCVLASDSNLDFKKEHGTKDVDSEDVGQKCEVDHLPLEGP